MAVDALPMLLLANAAVAAALWLIRGPLPGGEAMVRIAAPLAALLLAGAAVLLFARRKRDRTSPARMYGIVTLFGLAQGMSWSAWLVGAGRDLLRRLEPHRGRSPISALLVITTLLAFAPVPTAALALWLSLSAVAVVATGQWTLLAILVPLLVIAAIALGGISERSYAASRRWLATAATSLKAAILLREFEESRRGWFWETDARGQIGAIFRSRSPPRSTRRWRPSASSAVVARRARPLTSAARPGGSSGEDAAERTLGFHLSTRLASCREISGWRGGGPGCLLAVLSGRPAFDEYGNFLGFSRQRHRPDGDAALFQRPR